MDMLDYIQTAELIMFLYQLLGYAFFVLMGAVIYKRGSKLGVDKHLTITYFMLTTATTYGILLGYYLDTSLSLNFAPIIGVFHAIHLGSLSKQSLYEETDLAYYITASFILALLFIW